MKKKLVLSKETVRRLTHGDLGRAHGGFTNSCGAAGCTIESGTFGCNISHCICD